MKSALSALELAKLRLPGIPGDRNNVRARADRENWPHEKRQAQGGGRVYPIATLPAAIRTALEVRRLKDTAGDPQLLEAMIEPAVRQAAAEPLPAAASPVGARGQLRRDARLAILALWDKYRAATGQAKTPSRAPFCVLYNAGEIAVPAWVRKARPRLCPNTLDNWARSRETGINALAGAYRARPARIDSEQALRDAVIGALLQAPHLSAHQILMGLKTRFASEDLPAKRSLQRWIATWRADNAELLMRETDPDRWKSKYRVAVGDLYGHITRPNQLWEIDASPADVLLTDGRHSLYALIDIHTRRLMVLVTKTPRTAAALLLIRRAIENWGKPEVVRSDRGSDFTSAEAERFLTLLGITHDLCAAFSPEQKGGIERHIQTIQHGFLAMLPGFIGHSVADRKAIEARKTFAQRLGESDQNTFCVQLTRDELQAKLDDWCHSVYAHEPHEGLGRRTPFQVASAYTGELARIDDPGRLAMLLMPAPKSGRDRDGLRTVTKKGVRAEGVNFWADRLVLWQGKEVFVRLDPHDMGRVWLFTPDHAEFIGEAQNPERLGLDRGAIAAKAKAAQKQRLDTLRTESRRAKAAFQPHQVADAVLKQARAQTDNLVVLHRSQPAADTPALTAVTVAQASGKAPKPAPVTPAEARARETVVHRLSQPQQPAHRDPAAERLARGRAVQAALAAGHAVPDADLIWFGGYEKTSEWLAAERMRKAFAAAG